jgi:signal transduction histidine kinase
VGNALTVVTTLADKHRTFLEIVNAGQLRKSDLEAYIASVQEAERLASRNLRKASDLIHSFKQVAIDQTSYQCRDFQLLETVEEVLMTIKPMMRYADVTIVTDIPARLSLRSFPGPLGQIITNMVANALSHAFDEHSRLAQIRIIAVLNDDRDWVHLTIEDNGKGIAPEHLKKVFDPFFTTRLGQGGSGLGLHIVHNLVTGIMGGKIIVESQLQKGTRFIMKLPVNAPQLNHQSGQTLL